MSTSGDWLVIGNGAISSGIQLHLPQAQVLARPGLDIRETDNELPTTDSGYAVICAAVTGFQMCQAYPVWSREVNVTATANLARRLSDCGWTVIMLSSSAALNPDTEYGKQKANLEEQWQWGPILRLPKVLHYSLPLIDNWIRLLRIGQNIRAHKNGMLQPISRSSVVQALRVVAPQPHNIYQVASRPVTWLTVARELAEQMGYPAERVTPQDATTSHEIMDSFTMRYLGWEQPELNDVIREVIGEWKTL